ncbi:MAG TPA: DUF5946 family protein [Candidatus Acidoferrales bacterium]|nr:DUF5946 family protein [Candidatus Acidoferrales bacterium]HEV2340522.1 DUF5946 family protein [Candidatus Acidoferrales bacterium]
MPQPFIQQPKSEVEMCPDCGAPVAGGSAGCQALFNQIGVRSYENPGYAAAHELFVDAYCLQHPEPYCHSAKSYAAHLTRMCCGIERGGDRKIYRAIHIWLSGPAKIEKPEVLASRGELTIAHVQAARSVEEHQKSVREWAENIWKAYAPQHALARKWLDAALSHKAKS